MPETTSVSNSLKKWVHAHIKEISTPEKLAHISFRQVSHQRGKWKQVARVPGVDSFRSSLFVFARFKFKKMAPHNPFGQTMTTFWKIARKLVSNVWKDVFCVYLFIIDGQRCCVRCRKWLWVDESDIKNDQRACWKLNLESSKPTLWKKQHHNTPLSVFPGQL